MSMLTSFMRGHGLGPLLDFIEKTESDIGAVGGQGQLAASTSTAITGSLKADAKIAIEDVGAMVGSVVIGAIERVAPGAGTVAKEVLTPLLAEAEKLAEGVANTILP